MDFVKDWTITQTLGEGAYGEVKLLINKKTGECVAMKAIDITKNSSVSNGVKKEVAIHRILKDPSIIGFYGNRVHAGMAYIFLEYAPHGELFDKIDSDAGMPEPQAHKYMGQLLAGVEYLHSKGIAHRDIKPENLLLDENDNLKISDFGLATVFRANGKERPLDRKCGTRPYMAPEVHTRPYAAEPADIWSCGIVLVTMLAGELPWDSAHEEDCSDYRLWKEGDYAGTVPWNKIDALPTALIENILAHLPSTRYTIPQIRAHRWFKTYHGGGQLPQEVKKKMRTVDKDNYPSSSSQVESRITTCGDEADWRQFLSQPIRLSDMLISTQLLNTQSTSAKTCLQKLVRRMTRFFVNLSVKEALDELTAILDELKLFWKTTAYPIVTISTVDKRKNPLVFKCNILDTEEGTLMDFRLSRGCGLEFKRQFVILRAALRQVIVV